MTASLLPELARVPGHLFWRAAARVGVTVEEVLPPGITLHEYAALAALGDDEAGSQQWLADTVSVSRTTMARIAAALADRGLVERVRNPADRRSYALARTTAGATAVHEWRRHVDAVQDALGADFTDAERRDLHQLLLAVAEPTMPAHTHEGLLASTGFLITRIHARMHAEVMDALRDLDLEPRHLGSLLVLGSVGPVPQAGLARHLGISGPSVVEITDHLERRGLVERRRLATDRRTHALHLLPGAEVVADEANRRGLRITRGILRPLGRARRERLLDLLVRFVNGG